VPVRAIVKPELLLWAREDAGITPEVAAKRIPVKLEALLAWEDDTSEKRPTVKQLRKLANIYKRPLAVFYLSEPPKTFQAMHDFRRLPGDWTQQESPELRQEIRRAHYRREVALALYAALGDKPPRFELTTSLGPDAEEPAAKIRRSLGIDWDRQSTWRQPYPALHAWRDAAESAGILVFQMSGVAVEEARGFSVGEHPLPVIAVNSKDAPRARIFSMLHEMTHLALRTTGLCNLHENPSDAKDRAIEIYCNRVAGAALVPAKHLQATEVVRSHGDSPNWTETEIRSLSSLFSCSREVLVRRLLILGLTTESFYLAKRKQYAAEFDSLAQPDGGKSAPIPVPVRTVSQVGKLFTRLVLDGYHQEKITSSDVSEYLGVRLKHMPRIELAVLGRNREFGLA